MSLRCSLLGHEYGESELERDREERGDEVVLSVTELERCVRCGNARIISENTEVTQRSPRDAATLDASAPATGSTSEPDSRESVAPATGAGSGSPPAESGFEAAADGVDGVDDGAEVVRTEEGDDRSGREPGSWPEHDDAPAASGASREWPSLEDDDEGFDASVPDDEPMDVEFGGGLTPQADRGAEILETEGSREEGDGDDDVEFVRSETRFAPDRTVEIEGETELHCPSCDASDLDDRESLRAGDICPACRRGYLAERER